MVSVIGLYFQDTIFEEKEMIKRNTYIFFISLLVFPNVVLAQDFRYPIPPDSIRNSQERIIYMVDNFWNDENISDTTYFQKPKILMDYFFLLNNLEEEKKETYISSFISLSSNHPITFNIILFWLDQILYNSSSPQYNEPLYEKLILAIIDSDVDNSFKILPSEQLKMVQKNKVGFYATNFQFEDKAKKKHWLYDIESPFLLLIFNNPECSLCHKTEEQIENDKIIKELENQKLLKVIGITPDAEYEDWLNHNYPSQWIVGIDKKNDIYTKRLYDIQRLPCIYLLDKDKNVLLKEADYIRVHKYLEEHIM